MAPAKKDLLASVGGPLIDFDNHFYEPVDCFSRHIEPKYRDLALVPKGGEHTRVWTMGDRALSFIPPGLVVDEMMPPGMAAGALSGVSDFNMADMLGMADMIGVMLDPANRPTVHLDDYPEWRGDRPARVKVMDEQGLEAVVMLPTSGVMAHHDFRDLPEAVCANHRAFNRWLEEDWGYANADNRIFSVPVLSLLNLDWAIEELERVAALGARFIWLPHSPVNGRSHADPIFDPFWARVEEMGLKLIFHIGFEGFAELYCAHWGEDPNRHIGQYSALQHYMCLGDRPIVDAIAALILHNLFGRFPGIELLTIENGSAWVPELLRSIDKAAKVGIAGEWLGGRPADLPSDIFRNHIYVNPYHEENVADLVNIVGADRVLFGSDFPHPEGLSHPLDTLHTIIERLPEADVRKVVHDNGAALLGLPLTSPAALQGSNSTV